MHVLRQDVVQVRAVVPHRCGPTGAPRQREEERGILLRLKERMEAGGEEERVAGKERRPETELQVLIRGRRGRKVNETVKS